MKNARVCALRKAPPCARFFIEASAATAAFPLRRRERARQPARRAGRTPPKIRTETPLHANAVARAYATQNPHRSAAACKTRSPVRTPPEIRTETPLHAKRGRPCVCHRNPHRNAAACKTRSPVRATALRQKAQKLRQTETPAQARNRRRVSVSGGLRSAALFARAFRCADKSAPGMPRPCSPLRRFRLRVHCRT